MLSWITGTLVAKTQDSPKGAYFWVNIQGIGLEVSSSQRSVQSSGQPGETIQLFTVLIVREDALMLVGFNTREERDLFQILQSASGVGTKVALALLSALSVSEIAQAVVSNQHTRLTQAKGVGSKLAQKITLELKEKMMRWRTMDTGLSGSLSSDNQPIQSFRQDQTTFQEAEAVLLSLGYQPDEIFRSFDTIPVSPEPVGISSEDILRQALQWLSKQ